MQSTGRAFELFDAALANSNISYGDAANIAQIYSTAGNFQKLEGALKKMVVLSPSVPEPRFDLARLEATLGQTDVAMKDLEAAIQMSNARRKSNPAGRDLLAEARTDGNLASLRGLPAFQKLVAGNQEPLER